MIDHRKLATNAPERKWWDECDMISTADARRLLADVEKLIPYRDELLKLASDLGEPDDPFAAWEAVQALKGPQQ
jgi:hypothetical protein